MAINATGQWFHNALAQALAGNIKTTDTLKMAVLSATPSLETAVHWSDVSGTDVSPTAGGNTLTGVTATETAANSWGTSWSASTAFVVGQVVRPTSGNGNLYRCVVAGTSSGTPPTFPTVFGQDVSDGGVTWVNCGTSITVLTAGAQTFTAATGTISPTCAAIYDAQSGTAATEPLVALAVFASTPTATSITVSPDPALGYAAQTFP